MMEYLEGKLREFHEFYERANNKSDPRTAEWLFVKDVRVTIGLLVGYIVVVLLGPHIMKNREPFNLKWLMVVYNGAMTLLNLYILIEILLSTSAAGYSYSCQEMVYSKDVNELRIASVLWWFYFSKIVEFLDTVFFILRKKKNQISFLHVYHHFSMVCLWWVGTKWVAGGQSFFSALINASIHVVMYTYYGLSAIPELRGYLWWKKYLTQLQLMQFCIVMVHGIASLRSDCRFPTWMQYALIGYMVSFLVLFSNFYLHAYITMKRKARKQREEVAMNGEMQANGVAITKDEKKTQ